MKQRKESNVGHTDTIAQLIADKPEHECSTGGCGSNFSPCHEKRNPEQSEEQPFRVKQHYEGVRSSKKEKLENEAPGTVDLGVKTLAAETELKKEFLSPNLACKPLDRHAKPLYFESIRCGSLGTCYSNSMKSHWQRGIDPEASTWQSEVHIKRSCQLQRNKENLGCGQLHDQENPASK